jgi:hypothetical protein
MLNVIRGDVDPSQVIKNGLFFFFYSVLFTTIIIRFKNRWKEFESVVWLHLFLGDLLLFKFAVVFMFLKHNNTRTLNILLFHRLH